MKIIVAHDLERGIGNKNSGIPWKIPEDMAHFRRLTMGQTVIMGRKTAETINMPLKGRTNIVLSRGYDLSTLPQNAWVIGGGEIYKLLMPLVTEMYITLVKDIYYCDTFFPLYTDRDWQLVSEEEHSEFNFTVYRKFGV